MRGNAHVRFGGRAGETDQRKRRHRAPVRPYLGNDVVEDVRRRVQQQTLGRRGRKGDPLYRIRRVLITAGERLSDRGYHRMDTGLEAGDPEAEVWHAWNTKEALRAVYRAEHEQQAREALADFYATAHAEPTPECRRLARTISRWQEPVLAYYRSDGLSTSRCEALNGLARKIRRVGHGFRNLTNYRLRLLLYCGGVTWQHQPAARLRRRTPRKTA